MKKSVLFLSYDGLSDQLGFSQIVPYLEIISKNYLKLKVLSFEKKTRYYRYKKIVFSNLNKHSIQWSPLFFSSKFKRISKIYDILKLFFLILINLFFTKVHIVHARGHLTAFIANFFLIFFKFNLIFDFRGFWVDERTDNETLNKHKIFDNLFFFFFKYLEKKTLKNSNKIVVLTKNAKKEIVKLYKIDEDKIFVIPCCTDYVKFKTLDSNKIIQIKSKYLNNKNGYIITYLGSLGGVYLLREMFEFFKEFNKINQNSKLLILTNDKKIAQNMLNDSYSYLSYTVCIKGIQRAQIPFFLSISDFTLSFIKPTYARMASCPTKLSESFAVGTPVISNKNYGDVEEIFNNYNCGLLLNKFSQSEYIRVSKLITTNNNFIKKNIKNQTKEYFDIYVANKKYNNIYKNLL